MKPATFTSTFAILDVKTGRIELAQRMWESGPVHVLVEMKLNCEHSKDDGVSQEFSGTVLSVKEFAR